MKLKKTYIATVLFIFIGIVCSVFTAIASWRAIAPVQNQQEQEIENVEHEFLPLGNGEKSLLGKGNKIISALEAYHAENNTFPEKLDELIPRYILEIPATGLKRTYLLSFKVEDAIFRYSHDNTNFFISVRYGMFDEWCYSSKTGHWRWENH